MNPPNPTAAAFSARSTTSARLAANVYNTFQGAAMGEAWSDFFALDFLTPEGVIDIQAHRPTNIVSRID